MRIVPSARSISASSSFPASSVGLRPGASRRRPLCGTLREAPIFRHSAKGGADDAISTNDVCRIVRDVAAAAGEDPADFGGHSLRVGGASDFRDLFDCSTAGLEEAERVLKKRGRWRSDIPVAFIYTRASLATALEASARLAHVDGGDIEASFSAWAEPAI